MVVCLLAACSDTPMALELREVPAERLFSGHPRSLGGTPLNPRRPSGSACRLEVGGKVHVAMLALVRMNQTDNAPLEALFDKADDGPRAVSTLAIVVCCGERWEDRVRRTVLCKRHRTPTPVPLIQRGVEACKDCPSP